MLRLVMIADLSDNDRVDGGVQAVTRYLVEALVRTGEIDLHLLGFRYGRGSDPSRMKSGYTRHVLPGASLGTLTGFRKNQAVLDSCLDALRPDVVHGQGAGHNGILASRSGFPSVVTVHGIMAEEAKHYSGFIKRTRHRLLSLWSDRFCIRHGQNTILISPYVANYFAGRLEGRRFLIPNPIADEFFHIRRCEQAQRVLFAGRLYALKGVSDLLTATAAVAKKTRIELVLAGSLDDIEYVGQLKKKASRLGIEGLLTFRGLLSEPEMREELGRASVLVLPSYQETAPMVIAEAMAAGLPVIASNVGGVAWQVREGKTGFLIAPGEVESLADRLITLLADRTLRERFGRTAARLAAEEYRADAVARKTIDVYKQADSSAELLCAGPVRFDGHSSAW